MGVLIGISTLFRKVALSISLLIFPKGRNRRQLYLCLEYYACNSIYENIKEPRVQTRFFLAEKEGFEPSLRLHVLHP